MKPAPAASANRRLLWLLPAVALVLALLGGLRGVGRPCDSEREQHEPVVARD